MHGRRTAALVLAGLAWTLPLWAGPVDLESLPASTRWIAHLDVERFNASACGIAFQDLLKLNGGDVKLEAVAALFSVHPLRDLTGITVVGNSGRQEDAILLVRGKLPAEKLTAIVRAIDGYSAERVGGKTLHHWPAKEKGKGPKTVYACFAQIDQVVLGPSRDRVVEALDTLSGRRPGLKADTFSQWQVAEGDFIALAAAEGLRQLEGVHPQAAVMKKVDHFFVAFGEEGADLLGQVALVAEDEETVHQIAAMGHGMIAFAQMSADKNPELARFAQQLKLTVDGMRVGLDFRYPVADLKSLLAREMVRQQGQVGGAKTSTP